MSTTSSPNIKYYRTATDDIHSSEGWFKNLLLLGLVNFVPVFGQMTVYGYATEWAHKAAWKVQSPMPQKIYGRKNSKMLSWGFFALVISFVFALVPGILNGIGDALTDGAVASTSYNLSSHTSMRAGSFINPVMAAFGVVFSVLALVCTFAAYFFSWVGTMRMSIYDKLGAGFQVKKICKMISHDFGGLLRIFGMCLLVSIVIFCILVFALILLCVPILGSAVFAGISAASVSGYAAIGSAVVSALIVALPLLVVWAYAGSVMSIYCELLVYRALGYWTQQFEVAGWGKKDDPLPFERTGSAASERQAQAQGQAGSSMDDAAPEASGAQADAQKRPVVLLGPVSNDDGAQEQQAAVASEEEGDAGEPAAQEPNSGTPVASESSADSEADVEAEAEAEAARPVVQERPAAEELAAEEPVQEEVAAEEAVAEEPAAHEEPAPEEPVQEEPASEAPAADAPADEQSAAGEAEGK